MATGCCPSMQSIAVSISLSACSFIQFPEARSLGLSRPVDDECQGDTLGFGRAVSRDGRETY